MKRKLLLVLAFIALPGFATALGLGKVQLNSALNQPFDARIDLLSASASELESLNVGLADTEAFRRAKIDRPFVLSKLKFEVVESESGADYIRISSREAIREPFLNFLLEANWSSGRMYREYTVLLDPPLYDPDGGRAASYSSQSSTSSDSYGGSDAGQQSASNSVRYSGNQYGPTGTADTLWSIASQVRPDSSVSVQQMMLALLRSNPEAFINGNINGLKRGQILDIPERSEIASLSSQAAVSEVSQQNANWSGMATDGLSERADSMDIDSSSDDSRTSAAVIEDDESELRLVSASSEGAGIGQGAGAAGSSAELALAREQLQVNEQENRELKARMQEAESIIDDLKRLIALKDDELATLQQQIAGGGVAVEEPAVTDVTDAANDEMSVDEEALAEDDEFAMEADDEDLSAPDEDASDESTAELTEAVDDDMEGPVAEDDMELEDDSVAPVVSSNIPPAQGIVDQALGFIMGNLIMIAGALGALIVVIILLLAISRRKQNAANEPSAVATTEFPDFDDAEAETKLPDEDAQEVTANEIVGSEDETILPVGETDADEAEGAEAVEPIAAQVPVADEEPEEEPLAEVNVLIAYEQFEQAEEFVRDAIAGDPENLEFHAKLLEVFYAANDKKSYEAEAQVLHDMVNGEGAHWEMTLAMWQEMSPARALFAEGADDDSAAAPVAESGGIMDITAEDESSAGADDAGVDFDLGMDMGAEETAASTGGDDDDILDITSDGDDVSILDVTTAAGVDESSSDEDLLDFTAAVGLETEELPDANDDDDQVLDITAGADLPAEDDVLDISHGSGEDLLDVTANANLEPEGLEEDLMDVTSSAGAEADGEELLEVPAADALDDGNALDFDIGGMDVDAATPEADAEEAVPSLEVPDDGNALDFDIGGLDVEPQAEVEEAAPALEVPDDGNALDFDIGGLEVDEPRVEAEDENAIEFDSAEADAGIDLELDASALEETADDDEDAGVEFDLSMDDGGDETGDLEIEANSDTGLEIDLSLDEDNEDDAAADAGIGLELDADIADDLEIDLTLDEDDASADENAVPEIELDMDFDLEIQEDSADEPEIDMDGTVEMPKLDINDTGMGIDIDDDDDDDDDDDHTVFVPRAGAADEQSAEDEIATKLDLAKAYVELGDKDSAKGILDEVLADGNDEQKQMAQDLIKQFD